MKNLFKAVFVIILLSASYGSSAQSFPGQSDPNFIQILLIGGNGTPDGAQADRDYGWAVRSSCDVLSFKVHNTNSTKYHYPNGDRLIMVWSPDYIGTTQIIEALCSCEDLQGNTYLKEERKFVTIHE